MKKFYVCVAGILISISANAQFGGLLNDLKSIADKAQGTKSTPVPAVAPAPAAAEVIAPVSAPAAAPIQAAAPTQAAPLTKESQTSASNADKEVDTRLSDLFNDFKPYKNFFFNLQAAVAMDDKKEVGKMVFYPIKIGGKNIKNIDEFVKNYDLIISKDVRYIIINQKYSNLFSKSEGVMFGDGDVWFTGMCLDKTCKQVDVKISAINIKTPKNEDGNLEPMSDKEIQSFSGSGCSYSIGKNTYLLDVGDPIVIKIAGKIIKISGGGGKPYLMQDNKNKIIVQKNGNLLVDINGVKTVIKTKESCGD